MNFRLRLFLIPLLVILFFMQCRRDNPITDPSAKLEFSVDTVLFDTVFTTVGSATRNLRVYNKHNRPIEIDRIYVGGGEQSNYRINVDGIPGYLHRDIVVPPNDSIYIFVEVTLDPNNGSNPLIITDSINFDVNTNQQKVKLAAWGQDAYFYAPQPGSGSAFYLLPECNAVWNNDKPHVVYGYAVVDSSCALTINAGTQVHFHRNSGLIVLNDGQLQVEGDASNKVVFQGDRLEMFYDDIPGQWDRIWLLGSAESSIRHAEIKNAVIGLQVDTIGSGSNYSLDIKQTTIKNSSFIGLWAQGSTIRGENCLITNSGNNSMVLSLGGDYDINHFTVANYWTGSSRQSPAVVVNNWFEDVNGVVQTRALDAVIKNTIIDGSNQKEFNVPIEPGAPASVIFDHCILKGEEDTDATYQDVFWNIAPGFVDPPEHEFWLKSGAFAIDKGVLSSPPVNEDIEGNMRGGDPDIGAYEY